MNTEYFVARNSIVRQIWGKSDTVLFIFAGAAAEFALSKAVDWLYFTGKLPSDPIGRLFTTVSYARAIIYSKHDDAVKAIASMSRIHRNVESHRGAKIPDWAYRDVLFMLVDYSIRSFELLERRLTTAEKNEVFDVFNRVGLRMGVAGLPSDFTHWEEMRNGHLSDNLVYSKFTADLFLQYRIHLGAARFRILLESQMLIVPEPVNYMLKFRRLQIMKSLIGVYKLCRIFKIDQLIKVIILPSKYKSQIDAIDLYNSKRCPFARGITAS